MTNIVRGAALVNGCEVTVVEGDITELNGEPLSQAVPASRGLALINGEAQVGTLMIYAAENGTTTVGDMEVPADGVTLVNGITCIRGKALVNGGNILRGAALVNELVLPIENGIPDARDHALVNGIPMSRGTVLVNTLEIEVDDGEVVRVWENGSELLGITLENGVGFVRGVPLVNGDALNRGLAMVNGLAIVSDEIYCDDFLSLEDMNMLTSGTALTNGNLPDMRGKAMVDGLEGLDGMDLKIAAGTILSDGSIVYENVIPNRGLALVNGGAYVRGEAMVNDLPLVNGNPVVNSSTINESSNRGTILVFDATDLTTDPQTLEFDPISFITGTTAGIHWIVPGTYISENFEISYGLGTLTIHPAEVTVEPLESFVSINEGYPLHEFKFEYEGWIEGDIGNESYTVFRDSDGIPYDPTSDNSAGTYIVMPTPDNDNYSYTIQSAILHVNPYGPGTRAIRPVLNCIQEIDEEPYFIANFEYQNRNNLAVYIEVGDNNYIFGTGIDWVKSDEQPTMFVPGGGSFMIYFDGSDLSWIVSSLEEAHKVSSAANASSSSTKCPPVPKSAMGSGESEEAFAGPDQLLVYPNPVTGWLYISMKGLEDHEMITLHDLSGRSYSVPSVQVRSDLVELDMGSLSPGSYVIRILMKDQIMFVPVIKN
jgi:hypothetical protein